MKRIEKLTPEQTAMLPGIAEEWIEWGLNPTPADRAKVEDGIRRCYEAAGLEWHGNVVWVDNPLAVSFAGPMAAHILGNGAAVEAVDGAVSRAVGDAVDSAVNRAVGGAVRSAVGGAVNRAVDSAVREAVDSAVGDAVYGAVDGAVYGAVREAVDSAVGGAVDGAVREAVHGAVYGAVGEAVDSAVNSAVRDAWNRRLSGKGWSGWMAFLSSFRSLGLELDNWHLLDAFIDANSAGWWWPHKKFVIVSENWTRRPSLELVDPNRPRGWGSHRMHRTEGPSVEWADWSLHFIHGVNVPAWVNTDRGQPDYLERVLRLENTEQRRVAIEEAGWDRVIDELDLTLVDEADDPGNPGHTLRLFDLGSLDLYETPVRLLVMWNASPDRDGHRRVFGETVPATIKSAVEAAAWQFDIDPATYKTLARAT